MIPAISCGWLSDPHLPSPSYIVDEKRLRANASILRGVRDRAGCRVVLALKGFSLWPVFPLLREYLDGCCASGLWEARLAREEFGGHVLTYSPAYTEAEMGTLLDISDHVDFNTPAQWLKFRAQAQAHERYQSGALLCGLRVNPEFSTGETAMYDPCSPGSRLGSTLSMLEGSDLEGLGGLHFHTLCEQGAEDLAATLEVVEKKFGHLLAREEIRSLNMGGGHWITKPDYNRDLLVDLVERTKERYGVEVWLEPGEAAAIHTGVLLSTVLDTFESGGQKVAVLDISASNHMPDVLEMPYRPDVFLLPEGEKATRQDGRVWRLGGPTCLAGDVIGDYAFPRDLQPGDRLVFDDMAHYTMVKTTFFNGVRHPDIILKQEDGDWSKPRSFDYEDFRSRLG